LIKDEVLMITTEENARGKCQAVTYPVADLVIPVENFGEVRGAQSAAAAAAQQQGNGYAPTPVVGINGMMSSAPIGTPLGGGSTMTNRQPPPGVSPSGTTTTRRGPNNTTEEQLIQLITNTIAPKTWSGMGGPGTIDYFPLTMSLVINQTPDIQEQI